MKRRVFLGSVAASTTAAALFERPGEAAQGQPATPTKVTLLGTGWQDGWQRWPCRAVTLCGKSPR